MATVARGTVAAFVFGAKFFGGESRKEMLTAEIIAVGSEMLTPYRTDTNSLWLTEKLNNVGIEVKLKTVVGDDDARLEEAIRDALKRSGVVVLTGGLGPTAF